MNLRAELIEAIAVSIAMSGFEGEKRVGALTECAESALDAALDMLYDNAEEWAEAAGSETFWPFDSALVLISALRAEVEE